MAFLAVVGGTGGLVATATAEDALPEMSAQELLVRLQDSKVENFSGTLVQDSNLGIPSLPGMGGSDDASLTSLISGTHTMDVWVAGPEKARLRVHGDMDESDVIVNGPDVWHWSYKDKAATHYKLNRPSAGDRDDARRKLTEGDGAADLPKTPQEAAERVLKAVEPTTKVSTARTDDVAGEQVYELVLEPQESGSLVTQVRIALDGDNFMPLRVQVLAQEDAKPAFQVAYTDIDYTRPGDEHFDFKAPPGTKVTESGDGKSGKAPTDAEIEAHKDKAAKAGADKPEIVGKGWTSVMVGKMPASAADEAEGQLGAILSALPKESGDWGTGRVLSGTAFTAVLTDDGRFAVGSVDKQTLFEALDK